MSKLLTGMIDDPIEDQPGVRPESRMGGLRAHNSLSKSVNTVAHCCDRDANSSIELMKSESKTWLVIN